MSSRHARATLREALALRERCLTLWSRTAELSDDEQLIASAPGHVWHLLLAAECCALSLGRMLRERGTLRGWASETIAILAAAEAREMQRVLAARNVLRLLDDAARESDVRVVILKGGVAAAEPSWQPVDLGDVDILVAAEDGERFWATLLRRGWRCAPGHAISFAEMASHDAFMAIYPPELGISVDFHQRAPQGGTPRSPLQVRALHGFGALDRQTGPDVTLAMLRHSVVDHPFRRGHLRDVLLIAQFVRELRDGERLSLAERLASDPYSRELEEMYVQASASADGRPLARDSRPTSRFVAAKYASVLQAGRGRTSRFPAWMPLTLIALERSPIRRTRYLEEVRQALALSPSSPLMRTATHHGVLPARLTWLLRVAYRMSLVALVAVWGPVVRRRLASLDPVGGRDE